MARQAVFQSNIKSMGCIIFGTVLEWYDFALVGMMAPIMAHLFFPSSSSLMGLLATFGVFASGFVARPLGGILFGHLGDTRGRKPTLALSIIFMALPTTLIGLLPTYASLGVLAPLLLIVLRIIQGISSSGEYPGAICFMSEIAPQGRRGLFASLSMFGVAGGIVLSSIISFTLSTGLTHDELYSWGWRIPFLLGLPLGLLGSYMRYQLKESPVFQRAKATSKQILPIQLLFQNNLPNFLLLTLLFAVGSVTFYLGFIYMNGYLMGTNKITSYEAMVSSLIGSFLMMLVTPLAGHLSDQFGRRNILLIGMSILFVSFYPAFLLCLKGGHFLIFGQAWMGLSIGLATGPVSATVSEMLPTETRYTGIGLGLNIGASLFGGTCPLIATYLVQHYQIDILPSLYPASMVLICVIWLYFFKPTCKSYA